MKLSFIKTSPSGNTTILVSTPVPREKHGFVSRSLMAQDSLCAEQVCFREASASARQRMQMMGGEFCVNAAMSMAACFLWEDGGQEGEYALEASGCDRILSVSARRVGEAAYECRAPLAGDVTVEGDIVRLPGITHRVIFSQPDLHAEADLRAWAREDGSPACGFMFVEEDRVRPLVYVPQANTMVWESACGSGTAALAAWNAARQKSNAQCHIFMPGGRMCAQATWENGGIRRVEVSTRVLMRAQGEAFVDL